MSRPDVEAVIFDLGGVLADFGGVGPMRELAGINSDDEVWRRWLTCRWVRRFERGECSPEEFATGVVSDWALPVGPEAFLEGFRAWLAAPFPGAEALVRTVGRRLSVGCLSNTNRLHWDECASRWAIAELFDYRFLSFEMGLVKPDRDVFDHVVRSVGSSPQGLLFLDDNILNVEAAQAIGLIGIQVRGVDEARRALADVGLL
jgi:putative hydrolase of the HAD superfamily